MVSIIINLKACVFMNPLLNAVLLGERITRIRPQVIDGEGLMTTCDYREDRLNVEIRNSKIVKILGANWL